MLSGNTELLEGGHVVWLFKAAVPSSAALARVSMKRHERIAFIFLVSNATTVTSGAVTFDQTTTVANSPVSAKALAFTEIGLCTDTFNATTRVDAFVRTAVTANSYAFPNTDSISYVGVVEFKAEDLDVENGYDCIEAKLANGTAQTIAVLAVLFPARYAGFSSNGVLAN